jgi:signal transduction histidine kinase/ligand-binding sensor domain-containing protein
MPSRPFQRPRLALGVLVATLGWASSAWGLDPARSISDYSLTSWSDSDELLSGGISAIVQDAEGYLLLGTTNGLVTFDGMRFARWQGEPALPETAVSALSLARDGSLWIAWRDLGITRVRHGRASSYTLQDGLPLGNITKILESRDGTIWVTAYGGVSRFREGRWEQIGTRFGLPAQIGGLYEDRQGALWAGTLIGVFRLLPTEERFQIFSSTRQLVSDFSEDADGGMWVTDSRQALRRLGEATPSAAIGSERLSGEGVRLLRDRHGSLWAATRGQGLLRIRPGKGNAPSLIDRFVHRDGLISDEVRTLLEDRNGHIWVGTPRGLTRLSDSSVTTVPMDEGVMAVMGTDDGSVWVGTRRGLKRIGRETSQQFGLAHGLPSEWVTSLHLDRSGTLWVGTQRGVARRIGDRFVPLPLPQGVRLDRVGAMAGDPEGGVWLSDYGTGVVRWHDGRLQTFEDLLGHLPGYSAFTDRDGRVWLGFGDGTVAVHDGKRFQLFSEKDGLPGGIVHAIHQDQHGTMWVGTTKGLSRFASGRFATVAADRLSGAAVSLMLEELCGDLWIVLSDAVVRVDAEELRKAAEDRSPRVRYDVFTRSDGLRDAPVKLWWPSAARDRDGRLWFVTAGGLAVVDPMQLIHDPAPPPIRVESLTADGRELDRAADVRLASNTARIEVRYSAVDLTAASKLHFRYRLDGFDSDWVDAGTRRQAVYTNLPPGTYQFRVANSYNDRRWYESREVWAFRIEPAFHQTGWFYAVCLVALGVTLWGAWRLRLRQVQTRFALVLHERARMAREIHDTLLQGLVGAAVQSKIISTLLDSHPGAARELLDRLRTQAEQSVRETRESIWNLRAPGLDADLAALLQDTGENLTAGSRVSFELAVSGRPSPCAPSVAEQLLRVAQEAIRNAVRHADATRLDVRLEYAGRFVVLSVSDNGRGLQPDPREAPGWGLVNMRERARQIGGRLTLANNPGAGMRVELVAPLFPAV